MKLVKNSSGNEAKPTKMNTNEYYEISDNTQRRQGDIYLQSSFPSEYLPNVPIPYWMLLNRTCQLLVTTTRKCKLPSLNYAAIYSLNDFVGSIPTTENTKNKIKNLINNYYDGFALLPYAPEFSLNSDLVANFNLIITVKEEKSPTASKKITQLNSPFSEHIFQRFSRFFYTVGYDDQRIKSSGYLAQAIERVEKQSNIDK